MADIPVRRPIYLTGCRSDEPVGRRVQSVQALDARIKIDSYHNCGESQDRYRLDAWDAWEAWDA